MMFYIDPEPEEEREDPYDQPQPGGDDTDEWDDFDSERDEPNLPLTEETWED